MPKSTGNDHRNDVMKFWNVVTDESNDSAEITLYGDIVSDQPRDFWTGQAIEGNFITPQAFADDLAKCKKKNHVVVRLNSCGGDLFTGIAIHNSLKGLNGKKTVIVEGIAASAASVIMCAGDDVQVYPGSIVMIHGVSAFIRDMVNLSDAKKMVKAMDTMENSVAAIYAGKTSKAPGELRNLMTRETWMTGQEAIDAGFANSLIEGDMVNSLNLVASASGKFSLKAGDMILSENFSNAIPERFHINIVNAVSSSETNPAPSSEPADNGLAKIQAELVQAQAECEALRNKLNVQTTPVNEADIKNQAIEEERQRISEIEAIAEGIAPELVNEAKFGEKPMTAQELAFQAMKTKQFSGNAWLNARREDFKASGAGSVSPNPGGNDPATIRNERLHAAIEAGKKASKNNQ